jgi:hypothetical protein
MKSTELTKNVANAILVLYFLYAIFYIPFNGTLISAAVGLVTYGGLASYEAAVALTIITGIVFALMVRPSAKEGFQGSSNPVEISHRVYKMTKGLNVSEPQGVFAESFVEGFEDLSGAVNATASTSVPASTTATGMTVETQPTPTQNAENPSTATAGTGTEKAVSSFRSGGTESDSLFKLGVIPEQDKGGYHIDQGTTVINALNALKPEQLKQMTDDTQKLIDTQKNLMGLLSSIKPMMADGKQMMDTFQQMFGNSPQGNPFA